MGKRAQPLYYLGRRGNPQLSKPYFTAYGQLSKTAAKRKENCAYGSMSLESFESGLSYAARIVELEAEGFRVNQAVSNG